MPVSKLDAVLCTDRRPGSVGVKCDTDQRIIADSSFLSNTFRLNIIRICYTTFVMKLNTFAILAPRDKSEPLVIYRNQLLEISRDRVPDPHFAAIHDGDTQSIWTPVRPRVGGFEVVIALFNFKRDFAPLHIPNLNNFGHSLIGDRVYRKLLCDWTPRHVENVHRDGVAALFGSLRVVKDEAEGLGRNRAADREVFSLCIPGDF